MPGRYSVVWDGRDDRGRAPVHAGYVVQVEATRQDGGQEVLVLPFTPAPANRVHIESHGRSEIGAITVDRALH